VVNIFLSALVINIDFSKLIKTSINMNHLGKLLIAICLFGHGIIMQAQETTTVSGGNATGSGGSVAYTIGQVAYSTQTGTNGSVAQGVQQPYEIFEVTGIEEVNGINLEFSIYPNPTKDYLNLTLKDKELEELSYQLYDNNGNLLDIKDITGQEMQIEMSNYSSAAYYLQIIHDQKTIKTFKIIKN
jgi:hypothetical protein